MFKIMEYFLLLLVGEIVFFLNGFVFTKSQLNGVSESSVNGEWCVVPYIEMETHIIKDDITQHC